MRSRRTAAAFPTCEKRPRNPEGPGAGRKSALGLGGKNKRATSLNTGRARLFRRSTQTGRSSRREWERAQTGDNRPAQYWRVLRGAKERAHLGDSMDTPSDAMDAGYRNALNERRDDRHIRNKRAARKPP
jgi:hypothetical protein